MEMFSFRQNALNAKGFFWSRSSSSLESCSISAMDRLALTGRLMVVDFIRESDDDAAPLVVEIDDWFDFFCTIGGFLSNSLRMA